MTKRVLSMLMALIMALSLCVPAFAADEPVSADEPAAEVEAPAAEAEETEAEAEPAEEAVDAPEAEPVDEPEVASVDEPMLVTLGVVTKEAHWELKKAVDEAKELLPGVQAGTLRMVSFDFPASVDIEKYAEDPVANDPFKGATGDASTGADFETILATAEKYLSGIEGTEVDVEVTTTNVNAITEKLKPFLKGGDTALVDTILKTNKTAMDNMKLDTLKTLLQNEGDKHSDSKVTLTISDDMKPVTTDTGWMKTYQADYLTKLQAAITAYQTLEDAKEVKYADFVKLTKNILDVLVLEADAAKPVDADATRLQAAIDKATAAAEVKPFVDKYVNINEAGDLDSLIDEAEGYQAKVTSSVNKFDDNATFWKVNDVIEKIENALIEIPSTPTLKVEEVADEAGATTVAMTVSVKKYPGEQLADVKTDGVTYGIAWEVTQKGDDSSKWFKATNAAGDDARDDTNNTKALSTASWFKTGEWAENTDTGRWEMKGNITNVGTTVGGEFEEGDVIVVHFYKSVAGSRVKWEEIDSLKTTIEIKAAGAPAAAAPNSTAITAEYDGATGTIAALDSKTIIGKSASYSYTWSADEVGTIKVTHADLESAAESHDYQLVAVQNGKQIGVIEEADIGKDKNTESKFEGIDDKLAVGKVTVILQYCDNDGADDAGAWNGGIWKTVKTADGKDCSVEVTIDPMTEWASAAAVEGILEAADALLEGDYKLNDDGEKYAHTIGEAFDLIEKDAGLISALLTDTTPSTATNHNKIASKTNNGALSELLKVCKYLEVDPADLTEFNKLMDQAQELVKGITEQDGTGTYTFDTLGKLNDLYEKYNDGDDKIEDTDVKSVVAAAVEALQDALDGLVKIAEIDKSELEAAIAAAEALNEEDYTPESWADLEDAIEAAKNVLADEDATQAQLTNAADKLNKAVAALVKDVDADDLAAAIEAAEAAIADPSKYTEDSVKAVQDAITAAEALGDDATADEIADAIEALDAAVKGLVPAEAEPELEEGWNLVEGEYYYCKDGKMVKSDWVKSKGLWYHMGADGTMDTGFIHIVDDWGDGWYYLEPSNAKGTEGRMRTGWWEVNDELTGQWGWFETRSNGHQGMCTYTSAQGDYKDYKPVK